MYYVYWEVLMYVHNERGDAGDSAHHCIAEPCCDIPFFDSAKVEKAGYVSIYEMEIRTQGHV